MDGQCDEKQQARADKRNAKRRLPKADREERRSARNTKDRYRRACEATEHRRQRKDTRCDNARGARDGDAPLEKESAERRRAAARKRHQDKRETENQQLRRLGERALTGIDFTEDEILFMGAGQKFTRCPSIALAYYYCCSVDPKSFVFWWRELNGDAGEAARERLTQLFNAYPKPDDIGVCQKLVEGA
ncbi:hypothetical protein DVH05_006771 [Phytophthora capsici]|nr:hypothetical protein DVH05_006771 [Phytophthora capsici]